MNVRPAGCLLSTLSLLALPGLGVMLLVAGFNDSGDKQTSQSLTALLYQSAWGMGLAVTLLIVGLFWA